MASSSDRDTDVLIAGAGPTGLVLALWLTRMGIRVRIIDKTAEPGTTSRALAVQARTLELYSQIGLASAVVDRGRKAIAVNLWVRGRKAAHAVFGDIGRDLSPYPYALIFPQDEHERLLIDWLAASGVTVERNTELVAFENGNDEVSARLKGAGGAEESCRAAYVAGCDGAHSTVREKLGIGFPGGTYEHVFYVADVDAAGPPMNGEVHVGLDKSDFLALFPLGREGHARLVGTIRDQSRSDGKDIGWNDVAKRVIEWMRIDVGRVNWFSTYRVHHRVADRFRSNRAFLLGDAAHIHSPVGGQGMNTGIGDAVNLAWKIAAVVKGGAPAALLETYEPERIAFARRLVATTDRAFTSITSSSMSARIVRLDLIPRIVPLLFTFPITRRLMFRTISQTAIHYRSSALSEGSAGPVQGGDRLPWVSAHNGEPDNYAALMALQWQVHVYGAASPELETVCRERRLPLHVYPWRPQMKRTGLRRNAAYLLRPDTYVALADPRGSGSAIADYLDRHQIRQMEVGEPRQPSGEPPFPARSMGWA